MPTSWLSWRRSLACKSEPGEVYDPQSLNADSRAKVDAAVFVNRRLYMRSGCSRSIAHLRDVIHSSRRIDGARIPAMPNFSPKSVESNDFVQSISHDVLLREHGCDNHPHFNHHQSSLHGKLSLDDIVANHHPHPYHHHHPHPYHHHQRCNGLSGNNGASNAGSFYGTPLHPSAHAMAPATPLHQSQAKGSSLKKLSGCYDCKNPTVSLVVYKTSGGTSTGPDAGGAGGSIRVGSLPPVAPKAICQRCGEAFPKYEALEQHHLVNHAVAELEVGDSSRNVVEIIFRTSWLRPPDPAAGMPSSSSTVGPRVTQLRIERILKVNNLARTLARFEDYREGVKTRASKLPKKHPRCLADGNELLRFYGARLECGLLQTRRIDTDNQGAGDGSPTAAAACSSPSCAICKIIRSGFPKLKASDSVTSRGILTTATSGKAHQLMVGDESAEMVVGGGGGEEYVGRSRRYEERKGEGGGGRLMAMLVCRVIAGRVHKPPQATAATPGTPPHSGEMGQPCAGFDSIAGGDVGVSLAPPSVGLHSRFEELTVFNPRAILPCFVVLYRC